MTSMRRTGAVRLLPVLFACVSVACGGPTASSSPSTLPVAAASPTASSPAPTAATTQNPTPSAAPAATTEPNPTPSDYLAAPPEFQFVNQFVMRVAVGDLNVRRKPSKSGVSNGKAPNGGLFMVLDWPIKADGYTWYWGFTLLTTTPGVLPALPTAIETGYDGVLSGWMATGTVDTPFLVPVGPRCPDVRDLANVAAMLSSERTSCFGSTTFELEGTYSGDGCGGVAPGTFEPDWLAFPLECSRLEASPGDVPVYLHFAPDGPAVPKEGSRVRVRGHFSDSRAATCRISVLSDDGQSSVPIANAAAEQWCRGKLVVESVEVIG